MEYQLTTKLFSILQMKQQLVFKKLTMETELMEVNPDDIELSVLKAQVRLLLRNPCIKWCYRY
jgi:hypothetical protein